MLPSRFWGRIAYNVRNPDREQISNLKMRKGRCSRLFSNVFGCWRVTVRPLQDQLPHVAMPLHKPTAQRTRPGSGCAAATRVAPGAPRAGRGPRPVQSASGLRDSELKARKGLSERRECRGRLRSCSRFWARSNLLSQCFRNCLLHPDTLPKRSYGRTHHRNSVNISN